MRQPRPHVMFGQDTQRLGLEQRLVCSGERLCLVPDQAVFRKTAVVSPKQPAA